MKVLLFDHNTGGHHLEYAGHLATFLKANGDEVLFATWKAPPSPLSPALAEALGSIRFLGRGGGNVHDRGGWFLAVARSARRCARLAASEDVDVVHFLYLDRSELPLLAFLRKKRRRAVFATLFWPYFVHEEGETVPFLKRLFHMTSVKALTRLMRTGKVDVLFVHTTRIKELLIGAGVVDVGDSSRITVVPDPAKEPPPIPQEVARADLGLPKDLPILLFFGGARHDKGPDVFLQALPRVAGEWVAIMAGEAGLVGEAEAQLCREALRGSRRLVTRFEFIPESDADRYFRAADVVVLPYRSVFKGPSGVLRRAAASGKPVIASNVGDVGPVVKEYGLGLVVPEGSVQELAGALNGFLEKKDSITREVRPHAIAYAEANDWRLLGRLTREAYLASGQEL